MRDARELQATDIQQSSERQPSTLELSNYRESVNQLAEISSG